MLTTQSNNQLDDIWATAANEFHGAKPAEQKAPQSLFDVELQQTKQYAEQAAQRQQEAVNQPAFARLGMQGAIGAGMASIFSKLGLAGTIGLEALGGLFPSGVLKEDLPEQELMYGIAKGAGHPIPYPSQEDIEEGVGIARREGTVAAIASLPFQINTLNPWEATHGSYIDTSPQTFAEGAIRNAMMYATGAIKGLQSTAEKGMEGLITPLTSTQQVKAIANATAPALVVGAAGQAGHDFFGIPGQLFAETVALGFGGAATYLAKKIRQVPLSRLALAEQALSKEQRALVDPYIKIAEKHGLPITLGDITDNPYVRAVEDYVSKNSLTGQEANKFRQEAAEAWGKVYEDIMHSTSGAAHYESPGAIAQEIKDSILTPAQKANQVAYRNAYDAAEKGLAGAPPVDAKDQKEFEGIFSQLLRKLGKSLFPTSAEKEAKGIVQEGASKLRISPTEAGRPELEGLTLRAQTEGVQKQLEGRAKIAQAIEGAAETGVQEAQHYIEQATHDVRFGELVSATERQQYDKMLSDIFGPDWGSIMRVGSNGQITFPKPLTPDILTASIRSLNDRLSWELPAVVNQLHPLRNQMKKMLDPYRKTHKAAMQEYDRAQELFGNEAKLFSGERAKWKKWGMNADTTPEQLANELNSIAKFHEFERDFGHLPNAKLMTNYIKRKKLDDVLESTFTRMGETYIPGVVSSSIAQKANKDFIRYLAGPSWKQFEEIARLDKHIAQKGSSIYTAGIKPETLNGFLSNLGIVAMVKGEPSTAVGAAITQKLYGGIKGMWSKEMATLYSDPELMRQYINIAQHSADWSKRPHLWNARMELFQRSLEGKTAVNDAIDVTTSLMHPSQRNLNLSPGGNVGPGRQRPRRPRS